MAVANSFARKSKITVPEKAHPFSRLVFAEMRRLGVTYEEMEWKSGVLRSTLKAWRKCNLPSLPTIAATLGVVGWDVLPIPKLEHIDAEVRADLEAVAAKHGLKSIPHGELIAACIGYSHKEHTHIDARKRRLAA